MKKKPWILFTLGALLLGLLPPLLSPPPAEAAFPVIDGANLSQNIQTAVRTLEAIRQRIQMIQNQAAQIEWMLRNVKRLDEPVYRQVELLLRFLARTMEEQTEGLVYTLRDLSRLYQLIYPHSQASKDLAEDEERRALTTLETFRAALLSTHRMAEDFVTSQRVLARMKEQALGSRGHLEIFQSQALLESFQAEEVSKLLQQVAVLTNLTAVAFAHQVSSQTSAEETFRRALEDSHRGAPLYETSEPLGVIPLGYPSGILGAGGRP